MSSGDGSDVSIHRRHGVRRRRRQLELQRLPVAVQDQVEHAASPSGAPRRTRCCASPSPQSGWFELHPVPGLVRLRDQLGQAHPLLFVRRRRAAAGGRAAASRTGGRPRASRPATSRTSWPRCRGSRSCCSRPASAAPRRPSGSSARPSDSIVTRQEVLHLPVPQLLDRRVVGRPLDPAVPALVVVGPVAVLLAVGLVVLLVVATRGR